jgi:putative ABC transport system permease protein
MQLAAYNVARFNVSGGRGGAEQVLGSVVTPEFLATLGVRPALGTAFTDAHAVPGNHRVAILSDAFWRTRFAAAPDVVGQTVRLDSALYTIVGVMPHDYVHPEPQYRQPTQILVPIAFSAEDRIATGRYLRALGRLAPGATVGSAHAELSVMAARSARLRPASNANIGVNVVSLRDEFFGASRGAALLLLTAATLVLLIVCVNVSNLLLARDQRRRRDFAVRAALGAGRLRLVRGSALDAVVTAGVGAIAGLALVGLMGRALAQFATTHISSVADFSPDFRVILFVAGATSLCACAFGALPAWRAAHTDLRTLLGEMSRGSSSGPRARRARTIPIVLQVALTTVLLFGSLLLARSLFRLMRTPTGFDRGHALTFELAPPRWRYDADGASRFQQRMTERLQALPGVQTVGLVSDLPFTPSNVTIDIALPERSLAIRESELQAINPQYFSSLGIPILRGRHFNTMDDAAALPVAVVNQSLAAIITRDANPVGQQLRVSAGSRIVDVRIVGVVGDVLDDGFRGRREPRLYRPLAQTPRRYVSAIVRTTPGATLSSATIMAQVRALDPEVPTWNVQTIEALIGASVSRERAALSFLGLFTAFAVLLAAVGIYGVIAFTVSERRREIGIRSALGAAPARLARAVLLESAATTAVGLAIGCMLALVAASGLRALLFGVTRTDPFSLATTVALLTAVALLAAWIPARRAARVQPWEALQDL